MLKVISLQTPTLPGGIVDVADLRIREWAGLTLDETMIEPIQFLQENRDRPVIARDVGEGQQEYVVVGAATD